MVDYMRVQLQKEQLDEVQLEILTCELSEIGFESFDETTDFYNAYIQSSQYNKELTEEVFTSCLSFIPEPKYTIEWIKGTNWNAVWEANFEPVIIDQQCVIYAPFHQNTPNLPYQVLIAPQMAFGTGHHETTYLVAQNMLSQDLHNLNVLDIGCGTAILAILAAKMGAKSVLAIDNDPQACLNARENIQLNAETASIIEVKIGDAQLLTSQKFDLILANINRNILLTDMNKYVEVMAPEGLLIMSGFYEDDVKLLLAEAKNLNLNFEFLKSANKWACLGMRKNANQ